MSRPSSNQILMGSALLLCTFHLLDIVSVRGQGQGLTDNPSPNLKLGLEVEKHAFILGEPVYISVRLRNADINPAIVPRILHPEAGTVTVQIATTEGQVVTYSPLFYSDITAPKITLARDEAITAVFPIFWGAQGWTFSNPGQYTITVIYRNPDLKNSKPVQSNTVNLTVSKGDGVGPILMNDSMESREAGKLLLWRQGDHLRGGIALLSEIVQKYPDSPISDYANLALGSNLAQPFRDYSTNKIRQPDYIAALAYIRKVRDSRLPRYLKIQKNLDQARCLFNAGEETLAESFIRKVEKLSKARIEFQPLLQKALRLEPRLKPYF